MVKEKRILSYFIGWLIVGFFIMFAGVNEIFAATYYTSYADRHQYYDNRGSSLTGIETTWVESLQSYISADIYTVAGSYGAGVAFNSPIPLLKNHTYSLSISFDGINNLALSTKNYVALGNSLYNAAISHYAAENYYATTNYSKVTNNSILSFAFTATDDNDYIFIPWTTTTSTTQTYVFTQIIIEDLGSSGVSQEDINNSLNKQTNEINQSIQNSTNTITGAITDTEENINNNIDDMEQSIIDSNKETQEVIKDQFNSCRDSYNILPNIAITTTSNGITYTINEDKSITINGTATNLSTLTISQNILLNAGKYYIIPTNSNNIIFVGYTGSSWPVSLNGSKNYFTLESDTNFLQFYYQIPAGSTFNNFKIEPMISKEIINNYEPYGEEICSNKIDETNDKLDGIQGALTDSSSPDTSGLENSAGWLPAGPLDSILNLPLTMLNSLTNSLGKTCAPLNLTLPYVNKNIQIPCLSTIFAQITGVNGLWTWVGTIASILILYNYLLNLYAWVDKVLTLRAEFDEAMGADMANWGRL